MDQVKKDIDECIRITELEKIRFMELVDSLDAYNLRMLYIAIMLENTGTNEQYADVINSYMILKVLGYGHWAAHFLCGRISFLTE